MDLFNDVLPLQMIERVRDKDGWVVSEEYVIPEDQREAVLAQHYPFEGVPALDEEVYDLHADKNFFVRDYKLVREHGHNLLVSPYYYESGGSVIDWMPLDFMQDDDETDEAFDDGTLSDAPDMDDFDNTPPKPGEIPF